MIYYRLIINISECTEELFLNAQMNVFHYDKYYDKIEMLELVSISDVELESYEYLDSFQCYTRVIEP